MTQATYEEVESGLRAHRIELGKFLTRNEFHGAMNRAIANSTRPVVMLCLDPECSKLKPRLEFLGKDRVEFKRKEKVVDTFPKPSAQQPQA